MTRNNFHIESLKRDNYDTWRIQAEAEFPKLRASKKDYCFETLVQKMYECDIRDYVNKFSDIVDKLADMDITINNSPYYA
ncbi:hypothetical protein PR048_028791 [Dryococelus australis]|uniref:Uncharacterized protein n=1 Tax=Dryococelus australis TaxID=614101 RepID=A0ABQ9GBJ6_9NEOP|nr:hypothetical protein PR048_028791 [Dryococelus australis]